MQTQGLVKGCRTVHTGQYLRLKNTFTCSLFKHVRAHIESLINRVDDKRVLGTMRNLICLKKCLLDREL